jgi:hypothetical protein
MFTFGDARLPERFWAKVEPEPNTGCWLWAGSWYAGGYGDFKVEGKMRHAHRVAYGALVGPIGNGLSIDHKCRVHCCVNPAHLEPVTHRENVLRGVAPPAVQARQQKCTRCGGEYTLLIMRTRTQRACVRCKIETGRTYYRANRSRILEQKRIEYREKEAK